MHRALFRNRRDLFKSITREETAAQLLFINRGPILFGISTGIEDARTASGKRRIVLFTNRLEWKCSCNKPGDKCQHRPRARKYASELGLITQTKDTMVEVISSNLEYAEEHLVSTEPKRKEQVDSVSHVERGPPACWRIDRNKLTTRSEMQVPPTYPAIAVENLPPLLPLDAAARCVCGVLYSSVSAITPVIRKPFKVFYCKQVAETEIETVACPICKHRRSIGPDLNELGLFNWNNSVGFARTIFDDYEIAAAGSVTPINTFRNGIMEWYINAGGDEDDFVSPSTFRRCLFAFRRLLKLDSLMQCPHCGSEPQVVIVDGKAAGFSNQHLTGNLFPSTESTAESESRPGVQSFSSAGGSRFIEKQHVRLAKRSHNKRAPQATPTETLSKTVVKPILTWLESQGPKCSQSFPPDALEAKSRLAHDDSSPSYDYEHSILTALEQLDVQPIGAMINALCQLLRLVRSYNFSPGIFRFELTRSSHA